MDSHSCWLRKGSLKNLSKNKMLNQKQNNSENDLGWVQLLSAKNHLSLCNLYQLCWLDNKVVWACTGLQPDVVTHSTADLPHLLYVD